MSSINKYLEIMQNEDDYPDEKVVEIANELYSAYCVRDAIGTDPEVLGRNISNIIEEYPDDFADMILAMANPEIDFDKAVLELRYVAEAILEEFNSSDEEDS